MTSLVLDHDQVDDLVWLLDRVADWLRHAGDDTRDDLAEFFNRAGNGRLATAGLIASLDTHALLLHRQRGQVSS